MDHQDVFVRTWDLVEHSYEGLFAQGYGKGCEAVLELVREMRRRGYDRVFRAGMAAFSLPDRPLIKPRRSA